VLLLSRPCHRSGRTFQWRSTPPAAWSLSEVLERVETNRMLSVMYRLTRAAPRRRLTDLEMGCVPAYVSTVDVYQVVIQLTCIDFRVLLCVSKCDLY
jgi:hypothetical protein